MLWNVFVILFYFNICKLLTNREQNEIEDEEEGKVCCVLRKVRKVA